MKHNKAESLQLAMAASHNLIKITEQCMIPPLPPLAFQPPPLPLTFFDIVFLRFPPVQRLFFYDYPHPKSQFLARELPNLKRSLSLALHHFYPLAGTLIEGQTPEILYSGGDAIHFTVAISHNVNYSELSANHARDITDFHSLVPSLVSSGDDGMAVLAVQATVFPNVGVTLGTTVHHAVADGSTYTNFMKTWASMCSSDNVAATHLPSFDRSMIRDPGGLKSIFLKDLELFSVDSSLECWDFYGRPNIVRATFVFCCDQLRTLGRKTSMKCSPYSLACGYMWACLTKARDDSSKKTEHFGFVTGCRPRHNPPLPSSYFGNCLGICCVKAKRVDLIAGNGAVTAAEAIWKVIKNLEEGVFRGAENWIKDVSDYANVKALTVAGSPKLGIYEVDFGWGRPRKVELVSIERTGALSLAESRDEKGGIEVGIVLPRYEMEKVVANFVHDLTSKKNFVHDLIDVL